LKLDDHGHALDAFIKFDVAAIWLDFIKLGVDTLKLDDVQHKFDDFVLKYADTLKIETSSEVVGGDQNSLKFSDDFLKLDTDLHKLNVDIQPLGDAYIKLAEALPAVRTPPSSDAGVADSLQHVLQLAHHFSLL
jgi:hypothetical protein